jgi:hypothetical protein
MRPQSAENVADEIAENHPSSWTRGRAERKPGRTSFLISDTQQGENLFAGNVE